MKYSLSKKLAVLIFIILIPMLLIIGYNLVHFFNNVEDDTVSYHYRDARLVALSLSSFADQLSEKGKAAGIAITETKMSRAQADSYLQTIKARFIGVHNIAFINTKGIVQASSSPLLAGKDYSRLDAFKAVAGGESTSLTNLVKLEDGKQGFILFTQIKPQNSLEGVVGITVDAYSLSQILPTSVTHGIVVITDRQGNLVYSNDKALSNLPVSERHLGAYEPVKVALRGADFRTRGTPLPVLSGKYLGAQVPVPDIHWTSGLFDSSSSALSHVYQEISITLAVIFLIITLTIVAAVIYMRGLLNPVSSLMSVTDALVEGNFDVKVPIETQDEIGLLAANYSRLQDSLKRTFGDVESLASSSRKINSSLEMLQVAEVALASIMTILSAEAAVLTLYNTERDVMTEGIDRETAVRLSSVIEPAIETNGEFEKGYIILPVSREITEFFPERLAASRYVVVLPLIAKDELIGRIDALVMPETSKAELEKSAVRLSASFAQQVAIALQNARLFEEQRAVADTLQDSLLTEPPYISGIDIGLVYRPMKTGARIGGDFYDFIPVREDQVVVVIGDISGKGLEAARYTSIAKGAIRSFALDDPDPTRVLSRASAVIAEQTGGESFVTMVYLLIDLESGDVVYANAGHPAPLVYVRRLDQVIPLGGNGLPIGTPFRETYPEMSTILFPGDKLVLYTDGLTEARAGADFFGEERVVESLYRSKNETAQNLAEDIADSATRFSAGNLVDDLAIIVIERSAER